MGKDRPFVCRGLSCPSVFRGGESSYQSMGSCWEWVSLVFVIESIECLSCLSRGCYTLQVYNMDGSCYQEVKIGTYLRRESTA